MKFTFEDMEDAYQYLSDEKAMYYIEEPYTREQTESFIKKYGIRKNPYVYALVEKEINHVIGHIIFHPDSYDEIYEVGLILGTEYQNQGYGLEILTALIEYAFRQMKLHKLVAETVEGNVNCMKLLETLHFTKEASYRKHNWDHEHWIDEFHYGLLSSDIHDITTKKLR